MAQRSPLESSKTGSKIFRLAVMLYIRFPILEPFIGRLTPGGDTAGFSAFVVGIGGMSISGLLIDIFRARRDEVGERTSDKGEDDAQP